MKKSTSIFLLYCVTTLTACGGNDDTGTNGLEIAQSVLPFLTSDVTDQDNNQPVVDLDSDLKTILADKNLTGDPTTGLDLPSINSPLSQLGMKLFYSKSLGGEMDSACVTCHHPVLGGGDNLGLGVGVHALEEDLLGPGRLHTSGLPTVPRNAPTTFNTALYRKSLFWDSRVTQIDGSIVTPDSTAGAADPAAGDSLLAAQARFPVTSAEEMKTENFRHGESNTNVRNHLAARIGAYDGGFSAQSELTNNNWEVEFQTAFGSSEPAETLVTYDNIAKALASYQGSQVFINNPWNRYLAGDTTAITNDAKRGAALFFTPKEEGGGDCFRCHQGDHFTDESHHVVAFPQTGPGKGDGPTADDDFGRARETNDTRDRYKFKTPSLLNVQMTAPYGHTGAYRNLRDVVSHYNTPENAVSFFDDQNWCGDTAESTGQSCNSLYVNARSNTQRARHALASQTVEDSIENIDLNDQQIDQLVKFLETLTDPCTQSRSCLERWIPPANGGPDGNQLNAVDQNGRRL